MPEFGPDRTFRDEIDLAAQAILQQQLQSHESIESRWAVKRDDQIDVAVVVCGIPRVRSEQAQRRDIEGGEFRLQCVKGGDDCGAGYTINLS